MKAILAGAWQFRHFIAWSIVNEFRLKFAQSRLGVLWIALHPLAQALLFAFVLSSVLSTRLRGFDNPYAYPIYMMSGLLGWTLFSEIIGRCVNVFVDGAHLLKKIRFPRVSLVAIAVGAALVNNLFLALAIVAVFGVLGHFPVGAFGWLPLLVVLNALLATGLGLLFGVLNVFSRDWGQVVPVLLQFWFWITPVVYPADIIPERFRFALAANPMYPIIEAYHRVLLYGERPDLLSLLPIAALAVAALVLSLIAFRRAGDDMADVL